MPSTNYIHCSHLAKLCHSLVLHYTDVIITTMASQITSLTVVYSTIYSDADQRKHQSSASLAFVWGIPRTKGQLCGKCFHLLTSSWVKSPYHCGLFHRHGNNGTKIKQAKLYSLFLNELWMYSRQTQLISGDGLQQQYGRMWVKSRRYFTFH